MLPPIWLAYPIYAINLTRFTLIPLDDGFRTECIQWTAPFLLAGVSPIYTIQAKFPSSLKTAGGFEISVFLRPYLVLAIVDFRYDGAHDGWVALNILFGRNRYNYDYSVSWHAPYIS